MLPSSSSSEDVVVKKGAAVAKPFDRENKHRGRAAVVRSTKLKMSKQRDTASSSSSHYSSISSASMPPTSVRAVAGSTRPCYRPVPQRYGVPVAEQQHLTTQAIIPLHRHVPTKGYYAPAPAAFKPPTPTTNEPQGCTGTVQHVPTEGRYGPAPAGFRPPTPRTNELQGLTGTAQILGAYQPQQYQQQPHAFPFPAASQHDQPAGSSGLGYYHQLAAAQNAIIPEGAATSTRFEFLEDGVVRGSTTPPRDHQEEDDNLRLHMHMRRMVDLADRNTYLAAQMATIVDEYEANAQEMQRAVAAINAT